MKQCKKCGETKSLDMYSSTVKAKTGVVYPRNFCKTCENERAKGKYHANIENYREIGRKRYYKNIEWFRNNYAEKRNEILQKHKDYRKTTNGRVNNLFNSTKARAIKNQLEFNITKEYIRQNLENGVCVKTGIAFVLDYPENGETRHKYSPSLDRKDRTKGYTLENTQVVVWCYNTGKGEMPDNEFIEFCKTVAEHNK